MALILLAVIVVPMHVSASPPTSSNLNGLVMLSQSNGWAVGGSGATIHFDGTTWSTVPSGTGSDLFGVSFGPIGSESQNSGFAVGGSGGSAVAIYWGGVGWSTISNGLAGAQMLSSVFELSSATTNIATRGRWTGS